MGATAIKATAVCKTFGEGEAKVTALKSVDFEAAFGEMVYVVGPSGCGKTTLLSVLSGVLRPDSGTVMVEDLDIWHLNEDQLADFRLNKVGFAFQDYHLFPHLTSAENVAIPLFLRRKDWEASIKEAVTCLGLVGLESRANLPPVKLSGGEQQRVAIARAIIAQPDILIMDEPTASLDGETGRSIVSFVKEKVLNDKRCIVIVTHDNRIDEYANRMLKMEDGKISALPGKQS